MRDTVRQQATHPVRELTLVRALEWVYADQLADRVTGIPLVGQSTDGWGALSSGGPRTRNNAAQIRRLERMGAVIRGSAADAGDLHPDAEAIHRLLVDYSKINPLGAGALRLQAALRSVPPADADAGASAHEREMVFAVHRHWRWALAQLFSAVVTVEFSSLSITQTGDVA